jgi:hypothetical protein
MKVWGEGQRRGRSRQDGNVVGSVLAHVRVHACCMAYLLTHCAAHITDRVQMLRCHCLTAALVVYVSTKRTRRHNFVAGRTLLVRVAAECCNDETGLAGVGGGSDDRDDVGAWPAVTAAYERGIHRASKIITTRRPCDIQDKSKHARQSDGKSPNHNPELPQPLLRESMH